jgi:hypothetical protein
MQQSQPTKFLQDNATEERAENACLVWTFDLLVFNCITQSVLQCYCRDLVKSTLGPKGMVKFSNPKSTR